MVSETPTLLPVLPNCTGACIVVRPMNRCQKCPTVVGFPRELGMVFLVTSDTPPTPTVVEPLPSKGSSYLQYGVSFMMIMGYFVSLQLILIPFLLLTMPQEIGLLEIYKSLSLPDPWPTTVALTVRTQSDHKTQTPTYMLAHIKGIAHTTHTHTHTHTPTFAMSVVISWALQSSNNYCYSVYCDINIIIMYI